MGRCAYHSEATSKQNVERLAIGNVELNSIKTASGVEREEPGFGTIRHGDVVIPTRRQKIGQGRAYLPGANDDDVFHRTLRKSCCSLFRQI
jgi:hypothetical protein